MIPIAQYDGSIRINTKLNTDGFNSGIKSMMGSLGGITRLLGIALSTASLIKFGKEAIGLASDLAEVDNVVNKAFGNMRGEMDTLADSAIKNLGMSRLMAYQTGSTFMSMGKSMIENSEDAKNMALSLTKLTANMSSFFNVSQDLASIALKSIYTGETETLKQYGVVMTEVNLKQFAMEQGITKAYSAMSQSEKVMLRYQYVMDQLSYIGDDFIDTQDSWANQTRILSEQWKEFLTIIGNGLITVLTPVVKGLNMIVSALISVANTISSVLSNIFGIQMQQMSATAAAAEDVAGGYADAADSMGDYTDATKKAAKAAKGALAPFDELNVLQKDTSSGSGSGSGGSSGMQIRPVDPSAQTSAIDQIQNKYKKFFDYINKLKDNFVKGFQSSWNKLDVSSQFENIKESTESIKNALADIFTDQFVLASVDNFVQTIATSLGSMTASVTSIGATIAENFIGGMANFLENNSWDIKGYIQKMFDVSADITELATKGLEAFANVFSAFGDESGQQITASLIQIFSDCFGMIISLTAEWCRDIIDLIISSFVNNQEDFKSALSGFLDIVSKVTTTISEIIHQITSGIVSLYEENIRPFIDNVKMSVSELISIFLDFWNTYMQPFLDEWAAKFEDTYENHLKPVIDNLIEIVGLMIDIITSAIMNFWENALQPLIAWIEENILPIILPILQFLWQNVKNTIDKILDVINFALSAIKLVMSALNILFTKDTDKVLHQTQKSVKDFVNSIIQMFENMVNRVINGINSLISGINNMISNLPDFLGGGSWHPNIPAIPSANFPRLANGGITTGRTLAEIGEAGREAVLPLENNTGWMDDLASKLASKMPDYSGAKTVVMTVDGKEFARINLPYLQDEEIRLGIAEG